VVTVIGAVRGTIVVVGLCKDEDVVTATEGIFEDGGGAEVDVGVMTWGLVGGRTVEIPYTELTNVGYFLAHGRGLITKATITIDPNIFCLDFVTLGEGEERSEEVVLVDEGI
jgi:hypothetical protein